MKAILVIDEMPNSCDKCEVRCGGYTAKEYKECVEKGIKRPLWCPLKPMPEPIYVEVNEFGDLMHTKFSVNDISAKIRLDTDKIFSLGWNACLDRINIR